MDITEYIEQYGVYTLEEKEFNEVDSLVLSQFTYLKFDKIVPGIDGKSAVSLEKMSTHKEYESLFSDKRYEVDNRRLFQALLESRRFSKLKCNFYVNIVDTAWEIQFSAVTVLFPNGFVYVAYRGTDETLVGWKEDFNMAFQTTVPAQEKAVQYLNQVAERFAGHFYTGGHSKGGNLAVYAAMYCNESVRERIKRIYSHDGPGFKPEILQSGAFDQVSSRIYKLLPHSSVIGMVLQEQEHYHVVACKSFGLFQHNPFNWLVEEDHFVNSELGNGTRILDQGLNEWIQALDKEELRCFVETMYGLIEATGATQTLELENDWKKNIPAVMNAAKSLDPATKKNMKRIFKILVRQINQSVWDELPEHVTDRISNRMINKQ
ncbi:MAG: DUF2974 domain-containing protein [Clostridia bacterium]|nr:DUF2974 domain-containing protein [Clostridia bacterium]